MQREYLVRAGGLPDAENALLWATRAWVIGHCRRVDVTARIEAVLARLGAAEAAHDLNRFMSALRQGALRTIEINCVCHPEVSIDERMLLDVFALQQQEDHDDAYAILSCLLTERASVAACESAQRVGLSLAAAGRDLRCRPSAYVRHLRDYATARPSYLLH